jgi:predicted membrane-bound mannosyltransferase
MQTRRELVSLVEEINAIALRSGSGRQTTIMVTSRDYWPLPWYLQDYSFVGYTQGIVLPNVNVEIIVASESQEHELIPLLVDNYRRVGSYPLRPAVTLVLYARNVSKQ